MENHLQWFDDELPEEKKFKAQFIDGSAQYVTSARSGFSGVPACLQEGLRDLEKGSVPRRPEVQTH